MDISTIEELAAKDNSIVAILLESIQGEGGVIIPDEGYLKKLRKIRILKKQENKIQINIQV